ncbi:MAG: UvrD-helicase domain-containing protein [Bacteroidales bacterium]|nr:UvrD-helicase domain-containing protein [Bacteroidales bacterium]
MKLLTASAGSGKTYNLAHTYIDYLLKTDDPFGYRHILAVTFTNKATAEMKERILKYLKELADSGKPEAALARRYLVAILHDYGSFGVSTIDSFFQKTLRSFARELGQYSAYQLALEKSTLVSETIDRMLDGMDESSPGLLKWLKLNALTQIQEAGWFSLDKDLSKMCTSFRSEELKWVKEQNGEELPLSKERLSELRKLCRGIISRYEQDAEAIGAGPDSKGSFSYPGVTKMKDPVIADFIEKRYCDYRTAKLIINNFYSLGLAKEFNEEFDGLIAEKNIIPLDESNGLLKKIIDGSDVPFVYEKTGSRYNHFLLDEFQDTSRMQWDNFLPLLKEAEAVSPKNLIVGDPKQSIYRWRGSDWRLLTEDALYEFPGAVPRSLDDNWRSTRTVVKFNGAFFDFAADVLGLKGGAYSDKLSKLDQNVASKDPQGGYVRVSFVSDQIQAILDSIRDAVSHGAALGDIAVLVRKNEQGADVAEALRQEGIAFISDDSLDLKSSITVRRLMSLLSFYDNPSDSVGSYLARSLRMEFPEHYHSLVDFCEALARSIREYDPVTFDAEALFVSSFMDIVQNWTSLNGNELKPFIQEWNDDLDENGKKKGRYIGTPAVSDAVRIMTVHKSKGLEFPHVIVPFSEKATFFRKTEKWCCLDGAGPELGHKADGLYRVSLSSSCAHSGFEQDYEEEAMLQKVDNLNVFYVALTRASKSLHIISAPVAGTPKAKLDRHKTEAAANCSHLLYMHIGCCEDRTYGTPYDFTKMERGKESEALPFRTEYRSIPLGGRLRASQDADDYFGEGGLTGADASSRIRGIELHRVLSGVNSAEDLPARLEDADREMLKARIGAHPEWFGSPALARNELTIFAADGSRQRPDRVIRKPDGGIVVIDYKFGAERESYIRQVRRYVGLFRDMGHTDVTGYVWYVPEDKVVEV